jgi:hypothetical protein
VTSRPLTVPVVPIGDTAVSRAATVLFLLAYFFVAVHNNDQIVFQPHSGVVEFIVMLLFLLTLPALSHHHPVEGKRAFALLLVGLALCYIQLPYAFLYHTDPTVGSSMDYFSAFVQMAGYILVAGAYGLFFYEPNFFAKTFWWIGRGAVALSLAALAFHAVSGSTYLLNPIYNLVRIEAFFSEPSALAPFLAVFVFLAARKRAWLWFAAGLACIYFAQSPTVDIVVALSLPVLWIGSTRQWQNRLALGCLLVGSAVAVGLVISGTTMEANSPIARLISGVNNIDSSGATGTNVRFAGAINVYTALAQQGHLELGYGLNSAAPYFAITTGDVQDHSLLLTALFSYGSFGLAALLVLLAVTFIRLIQTKHPYLVFYIPFLIAAGVNSAEGIEAYKFVIVGMFICWVPWRTDGSASGASRSISARARVSAPKSTRRPSGRSGSWTKSRVSTSEVKLDL